jgi:hypothetical protein
MLCAICKRDARGYGFAPRYIKVAAPDVKLCSRRCQDITARLKGMIDPNVHEIDALAAAAQSGGAFVEKTGKTDLAQWSAQEWTNLIDVIVTSFQDSLRQAYADEPVRKSYN